MTYTTTLSTLEPYPFSFTPLEDIYGPNFMRGIHKMFSATPPDLVPPSPEPAKSDELASLRSQLAGVERENEAMREALIAYVDAYDRINKEN